MHAHVRRFLFLELALGGFLCAAPSVPAAAAKAPVARIVFIGQKQACHCTQKRIAAGWKALQAGLGQRHIPVRRLQADVSPAEAGRYKKRRPYRAVPAIYFLTAQGKVIDLLQGIVTADDVKQVLRGR